MLATALLATLLSASSTVTTTEAMRSQTLVTYDEFMQNSSQERIKTFNAISAENRAALVREQMTRWQKKNAARLTVEQQEFISDALNMIEADMYDVTSPRRSEFLAKMKAIEARLQTLFEREDARNAFTIHGEYIPQ